MEYSGTKKQHSQHLLFFAFHRSKKATETAWDICMNLRQEKGLQSSKMAILTSTTCPAVEDLLNLTKTISKHF